MIKEPLLSVLTLGQKYDSFLQVVKSIVEGAVDREDFINVMAKDFYTDDDYCSIIFLVNQDYDGQSPLRDWFSKVYDDVVKKFLIMKK